MPDTFSPTSTKAPQYPGQPYRGLSFFTSDDVLLFGERDEEIAEAAAIVGLPATRVLLLHGLSGVGKSSFLRAGLLPALAKEALFDCPATASGHFDLIRCTDDPILCLARAVESWNSGGELQSPAEKERRRAVVAELGTIDDDEDRRQLAGKLIRALLVHATNSRRTLVITIDQAEEVLTLGGEDDSLDRKAAFFDFLLHLCALHVDLKLIISLRTEYYGQFSAAFGLDPASRHAVGATNFEEHRERATIGPDAYLLRPIRSPEKLENIILRPTSTEDLRPSSKEDPRLARTGAGGATKEQAPDDLAADDAKKEPRTPFDKYGFEFANDGVVKQMVKDLLGRSTTISTLPVLQVVCRSLHDHVVVHRGGKKITMADYVSLGGVDGRVGAYIDEAIGQAISRADKLIQRKGGVLSRSLQIVRRSFVVGSLTDRWREILCELVGQSEGGATTTRIQDEQSLVRRAHEIGFDQDTAKTVLRTLAHEESGVLRLVSGGSTRRYSLMHDALAAVLARWKQRFQQLLEGQRKTAKWMKVGAAGAALLVAFSASAAVLFESYIKPSSVLESASTILRDHLKELDKAGARSDTSAEIAARNLLGAVEYPEKFWLGRWLLGSWFLPTSEAEKQLKAFVERSPSYSAPASAVGINLDATLTARMEMVDQPGGPRRVDNSPHREYSVEVRDVRTGVVTLLDRLRIEATAPSFVPPAIGFVSDARTPTIYQAGRLYQVVNGKWQSIDLVPQSNNDTLPTSDGALDFLTYGFAEVVDEGIRFVTFSGRHRTLYLVTPPFGARELHVHRPASKNLAVDDDRRYFPTPAMGVDYFAGLRTETDKAGIQVLKLRVGAITSEDAREVVVKGASIGTFVPWLGYTPKASHALVRSSDTVVHAIRIDGASAPDSSEVLTLPKAARSAQIRGSNWERPQMAGFIGARSLVAWPIESGVMLAELSNAQRPSSEESAKILIDGTQGNRPGFSRLRFSGDGRFLIATTTTFGGAESTTRLHIWDLQTKPAPRNLDEAKEAACIVLTASRRGQRERNETFTFEGRTLQDPCHRYQARQRQR